MSKPTSKYATDKTRREIAKHPEPKREQLALPAPSTNPVGDTLRNRSVRLSEQDERRILSIPPAPMTLGAAIRWIARNWRE